MRTLPSILLTFLLLLLSACQVQFGPQASVHGSGTLVSEDRLISGVTSVSNTTIGDLTIVLGDQESLSIEAEDNLLPNIQTSVRNGVLTFEDKPGVNLQPTRPIHFNLVVKQLNSISNSSSGDVTAPALQSNNFSIRISSSGDVSLESLQADTVNVTISSSGSLTIASGEVRQQTVTLSSSGNYEAGNVRSESAIVRISSSGDATLWATAGLVATLSSSGNVHYYGNPQITLNNTSSGKLDPLGNK